MTAGTWPANASQSVGLTVVGMPDGSLSSESVGVPLSDVQRDILRRASLLWAAAALLFDDSQVALSLALEAFDDQPADRSLVTVAHSAASFLTDAGCDADAVTERVVPLVGVAVELSDTETVLVSWLAQLTVEVLDGNAISAVAGALCADAGGVAADALAAAALALLSAAAEAAVTPGGVDPLDVGAVAEMEAAAQGAARQFCARLACGAETGQRAG